jgi:hypothetical protein
MSKADDIRAQAQSQLAPAPDADKDAIIAQLQAQLAMAMGLTQKPSEPVKPKAYLSSQPFMRVPIMRGPAMCDSVQFVGGRLETDDPAVISVLDKMVATPGCNVYVGELKQDPGLAEMKADVAAAAAAAQTKMVAAGQPTA